MSVGNGQLFIHLPRGVRDVVALSVRIALNEIRQFMGLAA
jgi:hypothetical protein